MNHRNVLRKEDMMKKGYVKPELFYESFVLNQNIAACGIKVNYADERNCAPTLNPDFWLGQKNGVFDEDQKCETWVDGLEGYCYTSGVDENGRLFNS